MMKKISCIAIDDEPIALLIIRQFCERKGGLELTAFSEPLIGLQEIGRCKPDLVFLDIEMPGMNGIYIGNVLKERNKNIIIFVVTSYSEYLDEAMRFHVFRYLSKPLEKQRLFRNLKDALAVYHTLSQKIALETKEETLTLPVNDIILIETQGRKIIVHTSKKDYESIHSIQYWIEILPKNCFIQSHRSFIVNLKHVSNFNHAIIYLEERQFTA